MHAPCVTAVMDGGDLLWSSSENPLTDQHDIWLWILYPASKRRTDEKPDVVVAVGCLR